jgi:uncharacterized membrane protein
MEKANMRLATKVCLALAVVAAILWIAVEIMQAAGYVEANRLRWASGLWVVAIALGVIGMSLSSMAKKER